MLFRAVKKGSMHKFLRNAIFWEMAFWLKTHLSRHLGEKSWDEINGSCRCLSLSKFKWCPPEVFYSLWGCHYFLTKKSWQPYPPSQKSSSWVNFPKHLSLSLQEYLLYLFACLKTIPDDSITCRVKCKLSQLARCECKSESKIFAFYFVSFSEGEKLTKRRGLQKNWKKVAPLSLPPCPTTLPRPPLNGIANWLWFPPPLQVKAEKNWTCSKRQVRWCKVEIQGVPASALSRVQTLCCSVYFDFE